VSLSSVYRLVADEPFLRIETTGAAPDKDMVSPGCSVLVGFPFGQTTPIAELAYGTTSHWDRRPPRSNFLNWQPSPPPTVQDVTFEPTHDFVLPLDRAGTQLGAVYHQSTPAWAISADSRTLLGCLLRNAPSPGQGAQGHDTATHTQSYAVRVPTGLATPDAGIGPRTPLGEALLLHRPATGIPLPAESTGLLPDELCIATTTDSAAMLSTAKMGTFNPERLILRLYQPTDQPLPEVKVKLNPLIADLFGRDGRLDAELVTALETPLDDAEAAGELVAADAETVKLPMPYAYATLALRPTREDVGPS
jgi:alpha-mannosidase